MYCQIWSCYNSNCYIHSGKALPLQRLQQRCCGGVFGGTCRTGQGTGLCPTHFSQATGETRLFRRTLTCPLYRLEQHRADALNSNEPGIKLASAIYDELIIKTLRSLPNCNFSH